MKEHQERALRGPLGVGNINLCHNIREIFLSSSLELKMPNLGKGSHHLVTELVGLPHLFLMSINSN